MSSATSRAVLPGDSPELAPGPRSVSARAGHEPSVCFGAVQEAGMGSTFSCGLPCGAAQRGAFPAWDFIPIPGHTLEPLESQDVLPAPTREGEDSTGRGEQGLFCAKLLLFVTWQSSVHGLVGVAAVSKQRALFFPASRGSWCELNTTCLQPLFRATSPIPALGARHQTNIQQKRDGPAPTGLGGALALSHHFIRGLSHSQGCPS